MQIGSGPPSLPLSLLKALGVQAPAVPAGPEAAKTAAKPAAAAPSAAEGKTPETRPGTEALPDLGVARNIPRGSFIDFKA